ncbi:two-component sensor histidine kinase, partial [Streptomyces sp. SID335]
GPRIPPAGVSRLFEPFQRIGRKADNGHHGLGLSIVRSIAAAHDATLNAHARPQGGLVVEVGFPLRTTAPATETYDDVARALSAAPE